MAVTPSIHRNFTAVGETAIQRVTYNIAGQVTAVPPSRIVDGSLTAVGKTAVQRVIYSMAGQVTAVRVSGDTLVPGPQNPQQFNRYAYSLNSPLRYSDPSGHLSEDEIQTYFGYGSQQAMLDEGWNESLVNWLWDPDVTWGDAFLYDDGAAMLVLFEAIESGSDIFVGGFYGLIGKQTGKQVSQSNITWLDDHDPSVTNMERGYFESWEDLPVAYGTDGTPYYVPSTYVDIAIPKTGLAGLSMAGGVALVGCAIAEPCGIIDTGSTLATASTFIGFTSTLSGFAATAVDMLSSDVTLTDVYPTILLPNQYGLGTPPAHYHIDIAGGPRGLYGE